MSDIQIYHNPRCSKSRETLKLLQDKGISPVIVEYLQHAPSADDIRQLLQLLGFTSARELMRTKEVEYKEQNLASADEDTLITAMTQTPKLIERPIVINGTQARIGRPPEQVLEIL
ncbi:arsenate reductase (glutaredoxin) [Oceanobacter sp. 5_MG-2023]|uniref:arsenate reductase (glutaredoxin) n=1 Tax=Oceanobacter sp. 5_MG-2023 TaxID=3062645 RepID=UPI0026E1289C|nr:arsenate reductase (glutaredoxin) [Oceanobacter sp. 5_MG-2023]MDO6683028.1 arsenate reductase (glutaredoxin) [Oceanobacter sp. 5_MG-2023]